MTTRVAYFLGAFTGAELAFCLHRLSTEQYEWAAVNLILAIGANIFVRGHLTLRP